MNTMSRPDLPVVVIGAGPVGLAAAAHLVERGLRPLVLERGENVGVALGGGQLAGDRTAAREVRLVLRELGVCKSDPPQDFRSDGRCGGPALVPVVARRVHIAERNDTGSRGTGTGR